jgi:hypothetical protein
MRKSIVFVFVDGLGLGSDDPVVNPLAAERCPNLAELGGGRLTAAGISSDTRSGRLVKPIDANLGMPGLPQSGTGQATLFTGVNCAERAGRHYGPFPHSTSRPVIAERNVFKQLVDRGVTAEFANPYPERFFRYVERTNRWTVTTLCCVEAGIQLRKGADLAQGKAVGADITGVGWPEPSDHVEPVAPEVAGRRLAALGRDASFVLFEYFATDKAGHSLDIERAHTALEKLDRFIGGVVASLDFSTQSLVLTSDHGNIEDMSTKTHTRNPVPLLVRGEAAGAFAGVDDLVGVTDAVVGSLGLPLVARRAKRGR